MRFPITDDALEKFSVEYKSIKTLLDTVGDQIIVTDANANILYANHATAKNSGYRIHEIIGSNPGDLWGSQMTNAFYEHMWDTLKKKKEPFVVEIQNKRKDGTLYWQELHLSPILNELGDVIFIVGIEPNLPDKEKREEFRTAFMTELGHQTKKPLTGTKWLVELLQKDLTEDQRKEIIANIGKSNASMLDLITDLLTVIKLNEIELPILVCEMEKELQTIISQIKESYPYLEIEFVNRASTPPHIRTNKLLALQVFKNLLSNAADYSSRPNGSVSVLLQSTDEFFQFTIENDGLVIRPEDQVHVFKKLFRTKDAIAIKPQGSGLGLYIVQMICHKLGWIVSFQSPRPKKKDGAVFIIQIPKHVSTTPDLTIS